jgi:TolB protein
VSSACWLALVLAWAPLLAAASLDTIIIDAGYDRQTRIAVVPFRRGPEFAGQTGDGGDHRLRSGPQRSVCAAGARQHAVDAVQPGEVFFRDWRVQGMEYLVIGDLSTMPNGNTRVRFHLFDVVNERRC